MLLAGIFIFCVGLFCSAQRPFDKSLYHIAWGAKWYAPGISVKISSGPADNLEGQVFKMASSTQLGLLYEFHRSITKELNWYSGSGGHLSVWNQNWKTVHCLNGSDASIGVDAVVGLDYKAEELPFDISLDWQPAYTFMGVNNGKNKLNLLFGGIGMRLAF